MPYHAYPTIGIGAVTWVQLEGLAKVPAGLGQVVKLFHWLKVESGDRHAHGVAQYVGPALGYDGHSQIKLQLQGGFGFQI